MIKKGLILALFISIIWTMIYLFAKYVDCGLEDELLQGIEKGRVRCAQAMYRHDFHARSADRYIIRFGAQKTDTCLFFMLCSEVDKGSWVPSRYEEIKFFVIYLDGEKNVLPIWTQKSYELFKTHFPDSARLVDTTKFY
jgi:hypothetical protein